MGEKVSLNPSRRGLESTGRAVSRKCRGDRFGRTRARPRLAPTKRNLGHARLALERSRNVPSNQIHGCSKLPSPFRESSTPKEAGPCAQLLTLAGTDIESG